MPILMFRSENNLCIMQSCVPIRQQPVHHNLAPGKNNGILGSLFESSGNLIEFRGGPFEMHSLVTLADEIPWFMALSSLFAAMAIISVIFSVMRHTESISRIAMFWAVLSIALAAIVLGTIS